MKRFHIHVGVTDLEKSIQFYSTLFGQQPSKLKDDYAKWVLEDPRINFAISTRVKSEGIDHLGIQVDENQEFEQIVERLKKADVGVYDEGETTCCYAESTKAWVQDPSGVAWEAYKTMSDAEIFNSKDEGGEKASSCCVAGDDQEAGSACC